MKLGGAVLLAIVLVGCGSGTKVAAAKTAGDIPPPSATPSLPADANEALRTELSSGLYQLGGTLDSVQEALAQAKMIDKTAKSTFKEGMDEIVDRIDSVGSILADHNEEPPTVDMIKAGFSKYDDMRLKAVDDVNDAVRELKEVKGMVGGINGDSDAVEDQLSKLAAMVDQALDDAAASLAAFGGKEQGSSDVPVDSASPSPTAS